MTTRESERPGGALAGLWPPPQGGWIAASAVAVLYAAHLAYAAIVSDTALLMGLAAAVLLAATLLQPNLRADLLRLKGLEAAGVLFALVLAAGLWSLTPYVPGGPHPVWTYVDQPGAATVDRSSTLVELVKLLGLACFFLIGAAAGSRDERARFAVQLTVLAGAAFALWAFVGSATGMITQASQRVEAHFLNANTAGNVFAALLVLSVAAALRRRPRGGRGAEGYAMWASAAVIVAALLATASRGAFTAASGGLIAYLFVRLASGGLKLSRAVGAALAGLVATGAVLILFGDQLLDRFVQSGSDPQLRISAWQEHWDAFLRSPLLGYGLGAFEPVNRSLLTLSNFDALYNLRAPLNVYLQWLEEAGILGAAPMFLCVGWLVLVTLRGALRRSRMTGLLAGLIAVDVTFLVHGMTDSALQAPSVAAFWAWALGLQVALAQGISRR